MTEPLTQWIKVPLTEFARLPVEAADLREADSLIGPMTTLAQGGCQLKRLLCGPLSGEKGVEFLRALVKCETLKHFTIRSVSKEIADSLNDLLEKSELSHLEIEEAFPDTLALIEQGVSQTTSLESLIVKCALKQTRAYHDTHLTLPLALPPPSPRESSELDRPVLERILATNRSLTCIKLSDWKMDRSCRRRLGAMLSSHPLESLTLSNCNLDTPDVLGIAEALKTDTQLHMLDLSKNRIEEPAQLVLAAAITANVVLNYLNINGYPLTQASYAAFIGAFQVNCSLSCFRFIFATPRGDPNPDLLYRLVDRNAHNARQRRALLSLILIEHLFSGDS